jgi:transposase-like protein
VEVVTSVQRRMRWTTEQKLEIVKQTNEPGSSVYLLARQHGLTAAQLFQWRKAYLEGSLAAVGTNETVVPASELQEAMRRIKQLEVALGRKTLENEILKEAVDFAKAIKLDFALACIAWGRAIRTVCMELGVSRSNVLTKKTRSSDWADLRNSPPKADDADLKEAIASVVKDQATYCCRRVWARLKIDGRQINHKRVYRVMRDEGWLLFRQGQKLIDTRKHEGTVAVKEIDTRWCSDGLELSCDNGERVRVAFVLDCCGREIMSWVATTKGIDAGLVGDSMMLAVEKPFWIKRLTCPLETYH